MSLQLEKKTVEFDGESYELVCNMEALELLEDEYGGSMKAVMEDRVEHVSAALYRIMLNLARADRGEEAVEKRKISRLYSPAMLQELDSGNADLYAANFADYGAKLQALDAEYHGVISAAQHEDIVFADRFPFAYMMEDYGLHHHAAYEGCSAETEVSFDTFARLAETLNVLELHGVVVMDDSDHRIADTVIAASGDKIREIYTMQSMQAIGMRQIKAGATYLSIMEENLAVLRQVLY